MKNRYWLISILILLITCSYLFYYFYEMERTRKIEEIFSHQRIHAKQAARSFYELFDKWNGVLFYLSKDKDIALMNERGKSELDILLGVLKNEVKGITRVDETGKIIYTTPYYPNSIGADISKQKHMTRILSDHKPVVSDVFNAVQGFQAIVIHYPVFYNGKFNGTIAFLLNFRQITKKILDEIKIGNSGYALMLSSDGIELYCPTAGHLGKSIYETARGFPDLLKLAKNMISRREGTAIYVYNMVANENYYGKKIAYYLPIKIENTFWSLAVTYSENEITASLKDFGSKLILIIASIFLGGVIFSYFGTKALVMVKESKGRLTAEKNLRKSEERFRTIFERADFGLTIANPSFRFIAANHSFCNMIGYTEEELKNLTFEEITPPSHLQIDKDNVNALSRGEITQYRTEKQYMRKDGNLFWGSLVTTAVRDTSGNVEFYIAMVQDITGLKHAQEELVKFYVATEQSPAAIAITDTAGKIEYVNTNFTKISGYTLDEMKGKYLRILRPNNDPEENYAHIWNTIKGGSEWKGEYYNKKKDGTYYWESTLISPIKDTKGNTTHYLAIQEDITEKKQTLGELILAKDRAEEANRVKSVFLANMSHELRTPLIGILGYSEMLAVQLKDEEPLEMARGIRRSGNRLLNTLNLILDLTRIESDQFEVSLKTTDLVQEIKITFEIFKGAALEKKLSFLLELKETELFAKIDERMFRVILENLINNAIKFTDTGSINIIAGIENNQAIYIHVVDTGIGIAKENYDLIFEEFRQVSSGISRDYQGTGLGLSITKKYVELLGGTIEVESELNVGSAFTVRFPLIKKYSN